MSKNFYEILNIEIGASPDEIKKAYRNMANKFHPDKIKNEEQKEKANKIFVKINEAYKILSDEKARKEYDKKLKPEKSNDENGFFNVFRSFLTGENVTTFDNRLIINKLSIFSQTLKILRF